MRTEDDRRSGREERRPALAFEQSSAQIVRSMTSIAPDPRRCIDPHEKGGLRVVDGSGTGRVRCGTGARESRAAPDLRPGG